MNNKNEMSQRTIVIYNKNYGKIELVLSELLTAKKINKYQLAAMTGIKYDVISKWCNNKVERMDLDVLAKLCYVLECEIYDIIKYIKVD